MVDIYLMQMMKGQHVTASSGGGRAALPSKMSLEQEELEKEIDAFADELAENALKELNVQDSLIPPEAQKARLKLKFIDALSAKDNIKALEEAVELLDREIADYLDEEEQDFLAFEFSHAVEILKEESKNKNPDINISIQELTDISEETMDCIESIAKAKYNNGDFLSSKIIYAFLTIINHHSFNYWQRLGVSLHELNDFENAIHAYEKAWNLYSEDIPNRLFVAECYLKLNEKIKAEEVCETAKQLIESQHAKEKWGDYLNALENAISSLS